MVGSPPKGLRFTLLSQDTKAGVTIRLPYPENVSRKVIKNGKEIEYNQWNETE
jgi:hypothetical protein